MRFSEPSGTTQGFCTSITAIRLKGNPILLFCLCALLVLPALASSCGGSGAGKERVELTYEVQSWAQPQLTEAKAEEAARRFGRRLASMGMSGATARREGQSRIVVTVPGETDAEQISRVLGQSGQLQLRVVKESRSEEAVSGDASWQVSSGEQLKPDAEIVLPYSYKGKKELLKLGPTLLTGEAFHKATVAKSGEGNLKIDFELVSEGSRNFGRITTDNIGKQIAILLDYVVLSAPKVNEPITDGVGEITGDFSENEARELAAIISSGAIPISLKLVGTRKIGGN